MLPFSIRLPRLQSSRRVFLAAIGCIVLLGLLSIHLLQAGVISETYTPDKFRIVSIGVNKYSHGQSELRYAVADALAVGEAFQTAGNTASLHGAELTTLMDDQATLQGMRGSLQDLATHSSPEDVVVFYFAGRGDRVKGSAAGSSQFFLFPIDSKANPDSPDDALSAEELAALLLRIPARNEIVILDCNQSSDALDAVHQALNSDRIISLKARNRHFALLGMEGESNEVPSIGHGVLTYALIQGMKGGADADHNGQITEAKLEGYMTWKIPSILNELGLRPGPQLASYSDLRGLLLGVTDVKKQPTLPRASPDADTKSAPPASPSEDLGRDYALIFAGNNYDHWPTLSNPIYDAEILQKELEKNYRYQTELHKDPTYDDVFAALELAGKRAYGKKDRLLIYFAGHGDYNPVLKMGYVVVKDSLEPPQDHSHRSFIDLSALRDMIDSIPAEHILVVLDNCFGGTFDHQIALSDKRGDFDHQISRTLLIQRKLEDHSRFYLTSGGVRTVEDGEPGQHSPFARRFLSVLRTYGGDSGIVDMDLIRRDMAALDPRPFSGPFNQMQVGGDFIFIAKPDASHVSDPALNR
jgi:uncharacterized caspase-like protein